MVINVTGLKAGSKLHATVITECICKSHLKLAELLSTSANAGNIDQYQHTSRNERQH